MCERPNKYQKHIHRVRFLEWKRDDGTSHVWEFDERYKVINHHFVEPKENIINENILDITKTSDNSNIQKDNGGSSDNIPENKNNIKIEKRAFVIPILNQKIPATPRKIVSFPSGISVLFKHSKDPLAHRPLNA